jgi:hypothetical protein
MGVISSAVIGHIWTHWVGFKEHVQETPIIDGKNKPWCPVKSIPLTKPLREKYLNTFSNHTES